MPVLKHDLKGFADALDAQPRFGKNTDEPEGSRFIQMSDTMATAIAAELRDVARERLEWLSGKVWTPNGPVDAADVPVDSPGEPASVPQGPRPDGEPETDPPPKAERVQRAVYEPRLGKPILGRPTGTLKRFKNEDY